MYNNLAVPPQLNPRTIYFFNTSNLGYKVDKKVTLALANVVEHTRFPNQSLIHNPR